MVIHADKLRWLFWLRWKMLVRAFTSKSGRVSRIIGTIFLVIFGLPLMGSVGIGTYFAYRFLPDPINVEVLFLVLNGVYLLWLILPLMEFSTNEGLDLSKLTLFPLTRAELMASLVISTLLDIPTLGLLFVLGAVVAGWAASLPVALLAVLAMLIFYIQMIAMSQLVLALLMRTLQSRRFRDLSIVLVALFSSSCYFVQQAVFRAVGDTNIVEILRQGEISSYLQWTPASIPAWSIQLAIAGDWGMSLALLAGLLLFSVFVLYLWQVMVERGLSNPESGGAKTARASRADHRMDVQATGLWGRITSSQIWAILIKDLKYMRRDPQLQAAFVQSIVSILVLIAVTFFNSGARGSSFVAGWWAVMAAPFVATFSLYSLAYNILGYERQGLTTLFLFPIDPRRILFGKNLLLFFLGVVEMLLLVLLFAVVSQAWDMVPPALAIGLAGILIVLGFGNITSIFLPTHVKQKGRNMQTSANLSAGAGCLRALMSMVAFFVQVVVLLPVAAALILPVFFQMQWIWTFSIPASLIYAAAFYYAVTGLVAPRMLARAPEILEVVVKE